MTGKKRKNIGQRNQYYAKDNHPAIVSAEIFDRYRMKWPSVQGLSVKRMVL